VLENRALELLEPLAGLDPELVDEGLSRPSIDIERLGLPAGAVEREHQLAAETLAERLARHQLLQLGDHRSVPAEREIGVDPLLCRRKARLLEPRAGVPSELLRLELREGGPAPELERLSQRSRGLLRLAGIELLRALADEELETIEVELAVLDADRITGCLRQHSIRADRLAELRHVHLERLRSSLRRRVTPEVVDQPPGGDDAVSIQQQNGEERARFPGRKRERTSLDEHVNRAEDTKFDQAKR
jgi:hypothetical protein